MARREVVVLAVDVGLATGWALLDQDGGVLGVGSLGAMQVGGGLDEIIRLAHRSGRTVEVVVSRAGEMFRGEGHLAHEVEFARREVLNQLGVFELRAVDVKPSEVRAGLRARELRSWEGRPLPWRQREAVQLGRFYLVKRDQLRRRRPVA